VQQRPRLAHLPRVEHRVDRRDAASVVEELDRHGVAFVLRDVRVLGHADPQEHLAPVGERDGLLERRSAEAHAATIPRRRES
jgi:hypothetical protein